MFVLCIMISIHEKNKKNSVLAHLGAIKTDLKFEICFYIGTLG